MEAVKEKTGLKNNIKDSLKKTYNWLSVHKTTATAFLAMALCICVEIMARGSLWNTICFAFGNITIFLYDSLIIFTTLCVSFVIPKRKVWLLFASIIWIAFGITDMVILTFRVTPFEAADFSMLKSALTLTSIYMKWWQVAILLLGIVLVIGILIFAIIKIKSEKINWKKSVLIILITAVLMTLTTVIGRNTGILAKKFPSLTEANDKYGFAYCFSCSIFDKGISKPKDYSKETIAGITSDLESDRDNTVHTGEKPNIVFVQLESFWDIKHMNSIECSRNPSPNFDELMANYPSGYLTVPSIGAGTANTEFEVISGMNLAYFGTGEYPYKTILKKSSCESICYNLKKYGYSSHAIHNNSGTFYDRNEVFSSLGFDTYTSLEYMQNIVRNDLGWAKDSLLTDEIINVLRSTEESDFVYAISVQAHGKYPSDFTPGENDIKVSGIDDEETLSHFNYYANQVEEVDEFIGELTKALAKLDEPTVLVMYGDHLPTLEISQQEVPGSTLFQVDYVIWNNLDLKAEDKDLSAYQLNSYVMGLLGMDNGILTKLHQNCSSDSDYENQLELLQYDMLYGDKIVYGGVDFHENTELKMGTYDINLTSISQNEDGVYISGNNFTEYSVAVFDGDKQDTQFVDEHTLFVEGKTLSSGTQVCICQIGSDKDVLSSTASYTIS